MHQELYDTPDGKSLAVQLVSNPSHLEAVYPVVLGRARARQIRLEDHDYARVVPVVLHGDGAFAGQGIVAETLNLADLDGFVVGGTIHVVVNNLIGFTTDPSELHSSRFATDVAKRLPIPILHVNGENVAAVVRAGQIAADYRRAFTSDVVVDLIGYRRYGHSEVDDPTVTHPTLYARIKDHPPLSRQYAASIGVDAEPLVRAERQRLHGRQEKAAGRSDRPSLSRPAEYWNRYRGGCYRLEYHVETAVSEDRLRALSDRLTRVPSDFQPHAKIARLLQQRSEMVGGKRPVDFGAAETLALATLLEDGIPVRLSGQDSVRGTFSQRHAVLVDVANQRRYCPLAQIAPNGTRFEVYNSPLSEAAVLGFEYRYSRDYPETLVLWEAQFGDFANNAQVIIDQFIASAEDKWRRLSGLTLLLPHGYEGQGAGAFECPYRAISSARGGGQSPDLSTFHGGPVLSPAPAAGAHNMANTAGDTYAQEPAATFLVVFADFCVRAETVLAGCRRWRGLRQRATRAPVHRENRPRTSRGTSKAARRSDSCRVRRAACTVSVSGTRG